jgi:PAS domain S-box-containing protein
MISDLRHRNNELVPTVFGSGSDTKVRPPKLGELSGQSLLDVLPDAILMVNRTGGIVLANAQAERLLGYEREELIGRSVESLIPPKLRVEHRQHRENFFGERGTRPVGASLQFFVLRKDATEFPVEITFNRLTNQADTFLVCAIRNTTDRRRAEGLKVLDAVLEESRESEERFSLLATNVSGKLIEAQERERTRIARELYDDFSQSLALQCIDIEQLRKKLPDLQVEEKATLTKMLKRTKTMSADIRSLSHELHSSRLEHIGLVPAVSGLCKEIGKKYDLGMQFTDCVPPVEIPKDVALCLFRIAQEALRNVVKHSQAKSVWVELSFNLDGVSLRIKDDGKGFDPSATQPSVGLGLVGMSERLRLVRGRLSIKSEDLQGTEILAEVPLSDFGKKGWARTPSTGEKES